MKTEIIKKKAFGSLAGDMRQVFICECKDPRHGLGLHSEDDEPFVYIELSLPDCTAHWKERLKMLWHLFRSDYRCAEFLLCNEDMTAFCQFLKESKARYEGHKNQ